MKNCQLSTIAKSDGAVSTVVKAVSSVGPRCQSTVIENNREIFFPSIWSRKNNGTELIVHGIRWHASLHPDDTIASVLSFVAFSHLRITENRSISSALFHRHHHHLFHRILADCQRGSQTREETSHFHCSLTAEIVVVPPSIAAADRAQQN